MKMVALTQLFSTWICFHYVKKCMQFMEKTFGKFTSQQHTDSYKRSLDFIRKTCTNLEQNCLFSLMRCLLSRSMD